MATNSILPFGGTSTNILSDAAYSADAQRAAGHQPGIARSMLANKEAKQSSLIASALAQYIADRQATNIDDSLSAATIAGLLDAAITADIGGNFLDLTTAQTAAGVKTFSSSPIFPTPSAGDNTTKGATTAFVQSGFADLVTAQTIAGVKTFSSSPVIPTLAQFDNTTKAASSAFVQAALGNMASSVSYTSATVNLTSADAGKMIYLSGSVATVNLPALSSVVDGVSFKIQAGVACTINRAGSDTIFANGGGQTSISVLQNSTATIAKSSGISGWTVDGSSRLLYDGNFLASLAGNGYQKLPSGLIIQWGTGSTAIGGSAFTFPVTFPNAIYSIVGTNCPQNGNSITNLYNQTTSGFSAISFVCNSAANIASNLNWIAIGK